VLEETNQDDREKTGASMTIIRNCSKLGLFLLAMIAGPRVWAQGPPYQTDDPTPVDFKHYEAYIFGGVDGTPAEYDWLGPAFEFNWGAIPRVQLHAIFPLGGIVPTNNPVYAPGGQGPRAYGITDSELGVKIGFIKQTKRRPQIGTFTMFEIPTGSYAKGLGVGKVWYKLPVWVEKDEGSWTFDGGAGYTVVPQTQYRNFAYGGFLVKKVINKKLEFGVEVFAHGAEGFAAAQTQASTLIDAGGYYHFKNPNFQFLFAYGHSVAGQTENYAYLGLYYTWGKEDKKPDAGDAMFSRQIPKAGFR
jgi:outer membrane putative beta-barrel porin/alpha-amylase